MKIRADETRVPHIHARNDSRFKRETGLVSFVPFPFPDACHIKHSTRASNRGRFKKSSRSHIAAIRQALPSATLRGSLPRRSRTEATADAPAVSSFLSFARVRNSNNVLPLLRDKDRPSLEETALRLGYIWFVVDCVYTRRLIRLIVADQGVHSSLLPPAARDPEE